VSVLGTMLSGGKVLDKGMYGCIFKPELECKDKKKQPKPTGDKDHPPLSKLILKDDAAIEYNISKIIRGIPIWKNYFAVAESICDPAPEKQQKKKEKEFDRCDVLQKYPFADFRILSMSYYGVTMANFRFQIPQFDFMNFASHLIRAGALLNIFGVVHRDIHQGNILIDTHHIPRIIDFNLSIIKEYPTKLESLLHTYSLNISQEPPDSMLVNAIAQKHSAPKVIQSIVYKTYIMKKVSIILSYPMSNMYDELKSFYDDSLSVQSGDIVGWFNTYWRTVDSWAIGVNLVDLLSKLMYWSSFEPIYATFRSKITPLLRRMCAVSPRDRIDCVQALNYLDPNHFIIKQYAKRWLEERGTGDII
jgi:hypothetical protein